MATDVSVKLGVTGENDLSSALRAVESQIKNLNSEMKAAVSSMANLDSAEAQSAKKSDILTRSIDATKEKINILSQQYDKAKSKLDELGRELENARAAFGENSAEALKAEAAYNRQAVTVNNLGTKVNNATADLNRMEAELRDISSSTNRADRDFDDLGNSANQADRDLDELGDSANNARRDLDRLGKKAKNTGDDLDDLDDGGFGSNLLDGINKVRAGFSALSGGIAGTVAEFVRSAISGIQSLIDESMEYMKIMSVLESSSAKAGYSADETAASYKQLYQIIGDEQSSATALANLQALGLGQADLTTLIDGCIGAWATYGDSIPIDSLAEAVNETIQVGQVTGTFADALNWAGTSEDEFNEKLAATQDPAERAKLVLDELSRQGLPELADAYREANPELVAMNDANNEMKDALAGVAEQLAPVSAGIKSAFAQAIKEATPLLESFSSSLQQTSDIAREAFDNSFSEEHKESLSNFFSDITPSLSTFGTTLSALGTAMIAGIAQTAGDMLTTLDELITFFSSTMPGAIQQFVGSCALFFGMLPTMIGEALSSVINAIATWASNIARQAQQAGSQFVGAIVSFFQNLPGQIGAILSTAINAIASWASNMVGQAQQAASNFLNTIATILSQVPGSIASAISGAISAIASWGASMASRARSAMATVKNSIVGTLQSIPGQVASVGRNIVQGLWNGISGAASWLLGKIRGWCSSILKGIKGFFNINSPSRVMRDEVGIMLALGMAQGIEDGETAVLQAQRNLGNKLKKVAKSSTNSIEQNWKTAHQRILDSIAKSLGIEEAEYKSAYSEIVNLTSEFNNRLISKEEELTKALEDTGLDEATKESLNAQLTAVKEFRTQYEEALSEIEKAQSSMAEKLKNYGELFEIVKDDAGEFLELNDLKAQISGIQRYGDALEALKNRGISDSLLDEIVGLDVDKATAYTEKLLSLTDDEYSDYIALWEKKQEEAQAVAQKFYADELDMLGYEFIDKIPEELSGMKEEMRTIGIQGIQGMIDGMDAKSGALYATARRIISSAIAAMRDVADIHSPSRVTRDLVGKPLAEGIGVGFMATIGRVNRTIAESVRDPFDRLNRTDLFDAAAGIVNGNAGIAMAGAGAAQTIIIPVQLNGKQIAEVIYDPLKQVGRQRGQS